MLILHFPFSPTHLLRGCVISPVVSLESRDCCSGLVIYTRHSVWSANCWGLRMKQGQSSATTQGEGHCNIPPEPPPPRPPGSPGPPGYTFETAHRAHLPHGLSKANTVLLLNHSVHLRKCLAYVPKTPAFVYILWQVHISERSFHSFCNTMSKLMH